MMRAAKQLARKPPPLLSATESLFVDFDGTLADIAPHPELVVIRRALPGLLLALRARLGGAVAVVTGRPLADVDALIAPAILPGAGLHGAELRLQEGNTIRMQHPDSLVPLLKGLRKKFARDPRLVIEDKGAAVALHFRLSPGRQEECISAMRALGKTPDLEIIVGNMVVEARPRGVNKGEALRMLATKAPFAGRVPVFIGDDVTDEDGFRAVAELGGRGAKVGLGDTAARYRFSAVDEVYQWLGKSLRVLELGAGT